jgi:hypothetical protein
MQAGGAEQHQPQPEGLPAKCHDVSA